MFRLAATILSVALVVVAWSATAVASPGVRQGCLLVANDSSEDVLIHVKGSSSDGEWRLLKGQKGVLRTKGQSLIVDEDTVIWATTHTSESPRVPLSNDADTIYSADVSWPGCKAGWVKAFK
jgi:hypothetical protein